MAQLLTTATSSDEAARAAEAYNLFPLPPVTVSCSHEHAGSAGTVSISATTLYATVGDIRASLQRSGIEKLVVVNGHGGNYVLGNIVQEASVDGPHVGLFPTSGDWATARAAGGLVTDGHEDMHAGELETSILLYATPELVRPGAADWDASDRPYLHSLGFRGYTSSGVIGRPSLGTAEKGEAVLASLVDSFRELVETMTDG